MRKILTAMSGGVDSAVTAGLLRQMGYEPGGATMLLRPGGEQEAADAAAAARRLDPVFHCLQWGPGVEPMGCASFAQGS